MQVKGATAVEEAAGVLEVVAFILAEVVAATTAEGRWWRQQRRKRRSRWPRRPTLLEES